MLNLYVEVRCLGTKWGVVLIAETPNVRLTRFSGVVIEPHELTLEEAVEKARKYKDWINSGPVCLWSTDNLATKQVRDEIFRSSENEPSSEVL